MFHASDPEKHGNWPSDDLPSLSADTASMRRDTPALPQFRVGQRMIAMLPNVVALPGIESAPP